jgi:hypothetical protein
MRESDEESYKRKLLANMFIEFSHHQIACDFLGTALSSRPFGLVVF